MGLEVLIVDNGSTDDTWEQIDAAAAANTAIQPLRFGESNDTSLRHLPRTIANLFGFHWSRKRLLHFVPEPFFPKTKYDKHIKLPTILIHQNSRCAAGLPARFGTLICTNQRAENIKTSM